MKTKTIKGKKYKLVPIKEDKNKAREKSLKWWTDKFNIKVKKNISLKLPTKKGLKEYSGVEFDNGVKAVYLDSGFLKKAWA